MKTAREMNERIHALSGAIYSLQMEKTALAVAAVNGEEAAIARRAAIDVELGKFNAESDAIREALAVTIKKERLDAERAENAAREKHMSEARAQAKRVIALAARADAIVAEYRTLLGDIGDTELAIHTALIAARRPADTSTVGRRGLVATAAERMDIMIKRGDRFTNVQKADVKHVAAVAWRDLIDGEHDDA